MKPNHLLVISLPLLLTACNRGPTGYQPQPVVDSKPVQEAAVKANTFIPLQVGQRWEYAMETITKPRGRAAPRTERDVVVFTVDSVNDTPKGKQASISIRQGERQVDRQTWLLNSQGLYQVSAGAKNTPFSTPQPLVLFPIEKNKKFRWKGTGICPDGQMGRIEAQAEVQGPQTVDLARGRDSGLAVVQAQKFESAKRKGVLVVTTWYKPEVGILRLKQVVVLPGGQIANTLALRPTSPEIKLN